MQQGLIHLYWGEGKGKTTAAMGLALRALGNGKRVVIVQFLKGGDSGEIPLLRSLGATVYRGKAGQKFVHQMSEAEKVQTRDMQTENLRRALADTADLLNLDETLIALAMSAAEDSDSRKALEALPKLKGMEVHMTHIPSPGDSAGLRKLGIQFTSDPIYPAKNLI